MITEIEQHVQRRDTNILEAAWRIIEMNGLKALTREAIAREAGMSPASVSNFGRTSISNTPSDGTPYRDRVLAAVMARAIEKSDLRMMRIGLLDGCLTLDAVPPGLRASVRI